MANELDPRLEARLREALHHEADALPFTLTSSDLEATRRERRSVGARLRLPGSILAAAAAIVVLVVAATAWRTMPQVGMETASPNPDAAGLESYEELGARLPASGGQMVLAQGEDLVGAATDSGLRETVIGTVPATTYVDVVFHCRGRSLSFSLRGDPDGEPGGARPCDQQPAVFSIPGLDIPSELVVIAPANTIWRVVVGGATAGEGSTAPAPSSAALPSPDDCVPLIQDPQARGLTLDNGSGYPAGGLPPEGVGTLMWHTYDGRTVSGGPANWTEPGGPLAVDDQVGLSFDPGWNCFAEYGVGVMSLADLRSALAAGTDPPLSTSALAVSSDGRRVTIKAIPPGDQVLQFSATWRTTDGTDNTDVWLIPVQVVDLFPARSAPPSGSDVLPSYEDLAAGALSTIEVARAEGEAEPADSVREIARLEDLWNLEIALACTGPGSIEIKPTGTSDSQSVGSFGCGDWGGSMLVAALDTAAERASDAALLATVPAGTAWRTIVFDHSADVRPMPKAPTEAFPMTDVGAFSGLVRGGDEPLKANTSRPVPEGATIEVAMGCTGAPSSLVHIVLDGVATDLACLESNTWRAVPDGDGTSMLEVSADDTVWVDIAVRAFTPEQAGAKVTAPSATLAAADGASSAPGFTTCLSSFSVQGGAAADEGCGPVPYVVPEARAVRVRGGESLELRGGGDWAITAGAPITYVPSSAAANATPNETIRHPDAGGPGVEGGYSINPLPVGDWTLRIVVGGTLDDDTTFTAEQLFRVIVEP